MPPRLGAPRPAGLGRPRPVGGPPRPPGPPRPVDCLGIIAGLGRGAPGTSPGRVPRPSGRSPRAAGGRGGIWPGPERRCMPCVDENGLLPGRGAPGLGAGRAGAVEDGGVARAAGRPASTGDACSSTGVGALCAAGAVARAAGRGAGRGPGVGRLAGSATAGASAGGVWVAGPAAAGVWTAGAAGAGVSAGAAGATCFAGAFFAAFFAAFAAASAFQASPCSLTSLATTGGSTVEDGDFTYSPMSFSAVRTTLLVTPNSFASSWTLALATILLLGAWTREGFRPSAVWRAHRMILIERS